MPIAFFNFAFHARAIRFTLRPRDLRRLVRWQRLWRDDRRRQFRDIDGEIPNSVAS
jgi:hypothetical protein